MSLRMSVTPRLRAGSRSRLHRKTKDCWLRPGKRATQMMQRIQARQTRPSLLVMAVFALLTVMLVGAVNQAQAQWTQPDASGNTNYPDGNVGIGTTAAPTSKQIGR